MSSYMFCTNKLDGAKKISDQLKYSFPCLPEARCFSHACATSSHFVNQQRGSLLQKHMS
jgi:hypothetical protein